MDIVGVHCNTLKYAGESNGFCCRNGKVDLHKLETPPELLIGLLKNKHFFDNIRLYNSAFQMTSFGADHKFKDGFNTQVNVKRQVYHLIGYLKMKKKKNICTFILWVTPLKKLIEDVKL